MAILPSFPRLPGRSWAKLLWGLALTGMALALVQGPHAALMAATAFLAYAVWTGVNTAVARYKTRAFVQRSWRGMLAVPTIWAAALLSPTSPWEGLRTPASLDDPILFLPTLGLAGAFLWGGALLWRTAIGRRIWAGLWPAYDGGARLAHHVARACVEMGFDPPTVRVHLTQGGDNLSLSSLDHDDSLVMEALRLASRRFHLESTDHVWPASWTLEETPGSMTDSMQILQLAMRNDRTTSAVPGKALSAHERLALLAQG